MRGCTSPDGPRRTDPSSGPAGYLLPQGEKVGPFGSRTRFSRARGVFISAAKLSPDLSSSSGKPRRPPRPGRHLTKKRAENLTESLHEEAARLRDEIKRMKKMDLEFAQDMMSS